MDVRLTVDPEIKEARDFYCLTIWLSGPQAHALRGKPLTITDEALGAPQADAAQDEATERAAEALACNPCEILVRRTMDHCEYIAYRECRNPEVDPTGRGSTRVAALDALAAKAKPRVKRVEEMEREELLLEIDDCMDSVAALLCAGADDEGLRRIVAKLRALRAAAGVSTDAS